ncbi:hypothetical protein [Methylobacter sp.]|uniref:hypothetical protein n=1 Tax=Methylobacter sp. TaxID=2051955 RepID=UPI002FDEA82C
MDAPFKLGQNNMAVLLDVHDILMTWNTDETLVLQRICDKLLFSSISFDLFWGGLIGQDAALSVAGAAGSGAEHIHGITLEYKDTSLNVSLRQCIDTLSPVYLSDGLTALNTRLADALLPKSRPSSVNMSPLTLENRCIGVL